MVVWKFMMRSALFLVSSVLTSGCSLFWPQHVEAYYPGGVTFIGQRKGENYHSTFDDIEIEDMAGIRFQDGRELMFHWNGESTYISNITTNTLLHWGVPLQRETYYTDSYDTFANIDDNDDPTREYRIRFKFKKGYIVGFTAWCIANSETPCPFALSCRNGERYQFPITEAQLRSFYGEPEKIVADRRK